MVVTSCQNQIHSCTAEVVPSNGLKQMAVETKIVLGDPDLASFLLRNRPAQKGLHGETASRE